MKKNPQENKMADELVRLHGIIEIQKKQIFLSEEAIDNLHHQATGYDAVLDFLWHKVQER